MKKLFKIILVFVIINLVGLAGIITWLGVSSIAPSFKKSDISFTDMFKKDIDPAKKAILEQSINEKSKEMGKQAAENVISGLKVIIPNTKVDYSKMPKAPYPYTSTDKVIEKVNQAADDGVAAGLKALKDSEAQNSAIKKQALADMVQK